MGTKPMAALKQREKCEISPQMKFVAIDKLILFVLLFIQNCDASFTLTLGWGNVVDCGTIYVW
jgi:hypothetical protein